jgi:hypothetical protein
VPKIMKKTMEMRRTKNILAIKARLLERVCHQSSVTR